MVKEDKEKDPTFFQKCLQNKIVVAVAVAVLTAVLLTVINPPMVHDAPKDAVSVPGRSMKKVLMWSTAAGGLTLLVPMCIKWYGASKPARIV